MGFSYVLRVFLIGRGAKHKQTEVTSKVSLCDMNSGIEMTAALQMQMEVQKRLHQQIEVSPLIFQCL